MFAGLCTISTNRCPRVRIDTRDHSKMSDRPPACSASATTVPLNRDGSFGRRTTMRVVYGASLALPVTKYSSVAYGKSSTCGEPGTTLIAGSGYIFTGPEIGPEMLGAGGIEAETPPLWGTAVGRPGAQSPHGSSSDM